ncbi:MAG: hypothetical protein WKF61_12380, partial [Luteimonas sp.]
PDPLSTEERELAQRFARLGAPGEPASSVDARILAAAHDAVARHPSSRTRRRHRWPVAFGVAASVALAVGIAWQLRPWPQTPVYDEAASASVAASAADSSAAVAAPALLPVMPPPAESAAVRALSPPAESNNAQIEAAPESDDAAFAKTAEPPIVFDKPRPADGQPAPAPPPSPPAAAATSAAPEFVPPPPATPVPPAPASVMQQRTRTEQAAGAANTQSRPLPATASKTRGDETQGTAMRDAAAAAEGSEEGFDERPPNTADSPEVRQAWLQRIRELIADGEAETARDSLQEFKRRHPGVVLPDDLRRFDRPL